MPRAVLLASIALGAALIAGASQAQTPMSAVPKTPAFSAVQPTAFKLDLSASSALRYAGRVSTPLPRGVARTAVEHQAEGVTAGAGLLCGLQPSAETSGAAMARGYDPDGKFVGAKLALRF